ncbi:nucleoporin NUP35 isoform X2 [Amblyraja radiata]|uniref:nucleoporin NUP35 isoform X2 n=1 Tax=Amblyraja radiata TaxID=386614 RepID=UPI00140351D3|nr:nucleoporin NUP35 isoform X2 [Amblyraja radiata]
MEFQASEPMSLGSPTSPKPGGGAQFLPGFLMGDLPAPVTPQARNYVGNLAGITDVRIPFGGGTHPQPVVSSPKDKCGGAPPVRSLYDDLGTSRAGLASLNSRQLGNITRLQTPVSGCNASTPGSGGHVFSPTTIGHHRKSTLSPAQADPFYTQGESLTSDDHLDETWITVFGFPPASASYILLQFAQYGNILKHVMSNNGNWMHVQYQSKLQARKALSKDGKVFGESIMIGVKPCIDKSVMETNDRNYGPVFSVFTPPINTVGTPAPSPSTPRNTAIRPLAAAYKASSSDYQVVSDRQTPRKDETLVSKAMEYMFGW